MTLRVACAILALTLPETKPALAYVTFKRRNKKDAEQWDEELLLSKYAGLSDEANERLLRPVTEEERHCFRKASAWVREHRARDWVSHMNLSKGVAPANKHLWAKLIDLEEQDEKRGEARPHLKSIRKVRSKNQWLQRWAKRCGIRKGLFKNGEKLSSDTKQAKARRAGPWRRFRTLPARK